MDYVKWIRFGTNLKKSNREVKLDEFRLDTGKNLMIKLYQPLLINFVRVFDGHKRSQ